MNSLDSILESIFRKVIREELKSLVDDQKDVQPQEVENEVSRETVDETQSDVPHETENDTVYGLSSCADYYIPYCSDIHSSKKTKNKNGTWKKMRGLDKDLFIEGQNKLIESAGLSVKDYDIDENGKLTGAVLVYQAVKKPAKSKPAIENDVKKEIIGLINVLTNQYKVDYDLIIETVFPRDITSMSDLADDEFDVVETRVKQWIIDLEKAQKVIDDLVEIGSKNHTQCNEEGIDLNNEITQFMQTYGSKYLGGLPQKHIPQLTEDLNKHYDAYVKYFE